MVDAKYPPVPMELMEVQSDVVEGTPPVRCLSSIPPVHPLTPLFSFFLSFFLFQAAASVPSMDFSSTQLGGTAEFERRARALGWTPPSSSNNSSRGSPCSPVLSPLVSDSIPLDNIDSDMADLQLDCLDMSAQATNDAALPVATDPPAEGGNRLAADEGAPSSSSPICRQLRLGNGTTLNFTKEEVGDPPAISFADDLHHLIQTWDDTSDDWDPFKCVLHIQGQPIAVIYWRDVYMYGKKGQWKGIQNRWTDWQVRVLFADF